MNEWEFELAVLGQELQKIRTGLPEVLGGDQSFVAHEARQIETAQMNVGVAIERIDTLARKATGLGSRERSLIHWSHVYSGKLKVYYEEKSKLLGRMLWIKLIQTRLQGPGDDAANRGVNTDDLIELAIRQAHLGQTEHELLREIQQLNRERDELKKHYDQLGVARINWEASGSMQARLGKDVLDALNSPVQKALQLFFLSASLNKTQPEGEQWLQKTSQELYRKTNRLLEYCRNVVVGGQKSKESTATQHASNIKTSIEQISVLETQAQRTYQSMMTSIPPSSKPKLVKKRTVGHKK